MLPDLQELADMIGARFVVREAAAMNRRSPQPPARSDEVTRMLNQLQQMARGQAGNYSIRDVSQMALAHIATLEAQPPAHSPAAVNDLSEAYALIDAERQRQKDVEGWTPEHDDEHENGELVRAGISYYLNAMGGLLAMDGETRIPLGNPPMSWPWEASWWKPKTPLRDLERAGALFRAEEERLHRKGLTGNLAPRIAKVAKAISEILHPALTQPVSAPSPALCQCGACKYKRTGKINPDNEDGFNVWHSPNGPVFPPCPLASAPATPPEKVADQLKVEMGGCTNFLAVNSGSRQLIKIPGGVLTIPPTTEGQPMVMKNLNFAEALFTPDAPSLTAEEAAREVLMLAEHSWDEAKAAAIIQRCIDAAVEEHETLHSHLWRSYNNVLRDLVAANKRAEELKVALAFYSNPGDYVAPYTGGLGKLYFDCGEVARKALAQSPAPTNEKIDA
jgi:hypothetical protein